MALRLYNTLTRQKEDFVPLDPSNVRMYVCGPTVYDFAHIGNARPAIVFDVLYRLLRHEYGAGHVTYVRNITDVDDKINARAARDYPDLPLNEAIGKVTETTERQYHADIEALGCLRPTLEPRATEHVPEMKALIGRLVEAGNAYVAEDHVLFDVSSMPGYGSLSRRSLDEMQAGARVDVAPYKKDPMDFVLWKPSKPGEPAWESPAGIAMPGRPGWHLECSAMAWKHLGETFDIHGGGIDLVFPHHENERAQTCCAFHVERMAQVWMHNGFLQVEGEKMAKSAGNFVTIRELLDEWPGPALRLTMLQAHYRQPINWTRKGIEAAVAEIQSWASSVFDQPLLAYFDAAQLAEQKPRPDVSVIEALSDDLNTPEAITALRALYEIAKHDDEKRFDFLASLVFLGFVDLRTIGALIPGVSGSAPIKALSYHRKLYARVQAASANSDFAAIEAANREVAAEGLVFSVSPNDGFVELNRQLDVDAGEQNDEVETLIAARIEARKAKNWGEADRIRDELVGMGIVLMDGKDPETGEPVTKWELAR